MAFNSEHRSDEKRGWWRDDYVSMVDLTSRITSLTTAILILFQFFFAGVGGLKEKMKKYIEGTTMLKERPGL